jgi:cytochrome c
MAAAALIALLGGALASQISKIVIHPDQEGTKAFIVDLPDQALTLNPAPASEQLVDIKPLLAKADPTNGEKIFKKCAVCHNIAKGQHAKTGPTLWNIVMAPIAKAAEFAYSSALKEKNENWTYDNLNKFLHKPRDFAPGTKMTFIGITNDQERADVIAYLRQQADNPVALP